MHTTDTIETGLQIGSQRVKFNVPENWDIITPPNVKKVKADDLAEHALPSVERMREILGGRRKALIVMDDGMTPLRVSHAIPALTARLVEADIRPGRIKVFVGHNHPEPIIGREIVKLVGEKTCGEYETIVHSDNDVFDEHGRNTVLLKDDTFVIVLLPVCRTIALDFDRHPLRALMPGAMRSTEVSDYVNTHASREDAVRQAAWLWLVHLPDSPDEHPPVAFAGLAICQDALSRLQSIEWTDDIQEYLKDPDTGTIKATEEDTESEPSNKTYQAVMTSCGGAPSDAWFSHVMRTVFDAATHVEDGGILAIAASGEEGIPEKAWLRVLRAIVSGDVTETDGLSPESRLFAIRLTSELKRIRLRLIGSGFVPEEGDDEQEIIQRTLPVGENFKTFPATDEGIQEVVDEIQALGPEAKVAICPDGPWFFQKT